MSTLVISDTHFTAKFDQRRFDILAELISESDKIIINGDFWEGLGIKFQEFLNSKWSMLFPLLKSKDTVYIYGNHDVKTLSDERIYQFCNLAVDKYLLETPTQKYLFRHGHEFLFPKRGRSRHERNSKNAGSLWMKTKLSVANKIQNTIFPLAGAKAFPAFFNNMSPSDRVEFYSPDYLLVCGHSHRPYYNPKINFIDIGYFNYGWANYLLIDSVGNFKLVSQRY